MRFHLFFEGMASLLAKRAGSRFRAHLIFMLLLPAAAISCQTRDVSLEDVRSLKELVLKIRAGKFNSIKEMIDGKTVPNYAQVYLMGALHKNKREYKSAILYFARAYFEDTRRKSRKFYPGPVYSHVSSSMKTRSPLHNEVLYQIASCYVHLNEYKYAEKFLDRMDAPSEYLLHQAEKLRAKILEKKDALQALKAYEKLNREHPSPVNYIRMGSILKKRNQTKESLKYFLMALEFPANDWTYKTAMKEITDLFQELPESRSTLTEAQKTRVAEGYRILKRLPDALALYTMIDKENLSQKYLFFYIQNYTRLLVDLRRFDRAVDYLRKNLDSLPSDLQNLILDDISTRLIKVYRYRHIIRLVPPQTQSNKAMLNRLQSLHKKKAPSRRDEARWYLNNIDSDSSIAERTFFHVCLEKIQADQITAAASCLRDLASATKGLETGGRSLYFLGFLAETAGKRDLAEQYYRQTYLSSPASMHAFYALERTRGESQTLPKNSIEEIRNFIAGSGLRPEALKKFFARKKEQPDYAVSEFWKEWEKSLENLSSSLKGHETKAMLFLAMGEFKTAAQILKQTASKERRLLIYQKTGILTDDPYLKFKFLKAYLRLKEKQEDIFVMSKLAAECMYPTPYFAIVREATNRFKVEPARIYAIMKQESNFFSSATSPVGASGVMQVMPATARHLNRRLKIKNLDLHDPKHSILLGTRFYADMSKMFRGDFEKIAMAYNAGPGRLLEWEKRFAGVPKPLFIEEIPFEETYIYVKKTRRNYDRYRILIDYFF